MDNYIVINGKKAELTNEQLEKLGIKVEKDIFTRGEPNSHYYFIGNDGTIKEDRDDHIGYDDNKFKVANYCTDKSVMEQRVLHETLNRLLWRYSMQHGGDKIDWNNFDAKKYYIYFSSQTEKYITSYVNFSHYDCIFFHTKEVAEIAIEEIVKPFMKEHPEFVW